jgi:hypothetical protein
MSFDFSPQGADDMAFDVSTKRVDYAINPPMGSIQHPDALPPPAGLRYGFCGRFHVTPVYAALWMRRNTNNRPVKPKQQRNLERALAEGEWKCNGETIVFNNKGNLSQGQHRLEAVVKTGIAADMFVVCGGIDDESDRTYDRVVPRTPNDEMSRDGLIDVKRLAAATRAYLQVSGDPVDMRASFSYDQMHACYSQHYPGLRHWINVVGPCKGLGEPSLFAALALVMALRSCSDATVEVFFDCLASGAGLERGSPILALRNRLLESKRSTATRMKRLAIAVLTIKAWNAWREERLVTYLRYDPINEPFPEASE